MTFSRTDLLALVHQFIENRTYNLAFSDLLNESFIVRHCRSRDELWALIGAGQENKGCLLIMDVCIDAIKNHEARLQRKMEE